MSLTNASSQTPSSVSTLHLYDNFDGPFLDPMKWSSPWQCGSPVMECVREINEEALRLRVRAYGATDSSAGTQFELRSNSNRQQRYGHRSPSCRSPFQRGRLFEQSR